MQVIKYVSVLVCLGLFSCKKVIDLVPESNLTTANFYTNASEINTGLLGAYNGLQSPMYYEWQLTELRSDNTDMGVPGSNNTVNSDLSSLDEFIPNTGNDAIYQYWIKTYYNIRNANIILQNLGVSYDATAGSLSLAPIAITITDSLRKQYAGEALVLRANAYFNLVRLYGGVFLTTTPLAAEDAKKLTRSSVDDIYKLIQADLTTATTYLSAQKVAQIPAASIGRVNAWVAKGLLAKVYLTRNNKPSAITLLQDIMSNSGYALQSSFANVFSITNEMNSEIMFAVRYKAGNLGLGSTFGNDFAPLGSTSVISGAGKQWNYPTNEIDTLFGGYTVGGVLMPTDGRKATSLLSYSTTKVLYVKKYLNPVITTNDGESDWPVLRYSDIILMLAEAQGYTPSSIILINQVRTRAGLAALPASVNSVATFEQALSNERRLEFAFENQRFFDLVRFGTTLTTINPIQVLQNHFAKEFVSHYALYPAPQATLAQLQSYVTPNKLLLPIPQHEIDTNTQLVIPQNPGY
ncbi:MAG: RagB/SusD family nutrient uptake outer membrane protein [Chitinophagaceae bacterium]